MAQFEQSGALAFEEGSAPFALETVEEQQPVVVIEADHRRPTVGQVLSRVTLAVMTAVGAEAALNRTAVAEEVALGTVPSAEGVDVKVMPGTTVNITDTAIVIDRGRDPSANLDQVISTPNIIVNTPPQSSPYAEKKPSVSLGVVCPPGGFVKEDGSIGYNPSLPARAIGVGGTFARNSAEQKEVTLKFAITGHEDKSIERVIPAETGGFSFQSVFNPSQGESFPYTMTINMPGSKTVIVKGEIPNDCETPKKIAEQHARAQWAPTTTTMPPVPKTKVTTKPPVGTIKATPKTTTKQVKTIKRTPTTRRSTVTTKRK